MLLRELFLASSYFDSSFWLTGGKKQSHAPKAALASKWEADSGPESTAAREVEEETHWQLIKGDIEARLKSSEAQAHWWQEGK